MVAHRRVHRRGPDVTPRLIPVVRPAPSLPPSLSTFHLLWSRHSHPNDGRLRIDRPFPEVLGQVVKTGLFCSIAIKGLGFGGEHRVCRFVLPGANMCSPFEEGILPSRIGGVNAHPSGGGEDGGFKKLGES